MKHVENRKVQMSSDTERCMLTVAPMQNLTSQVSGLFLWVLVRIRDLFG